jgi:putative DNA primase/helicase
VIPEENQDKKLAYKIVSNELPGVLNWVLEGLRRLTLNKTFTVSDIIQKQVEAYKNESDTAYLFLEEKGYVPDNEQSKPLREIYSEYKMFCMENNYIAFSNRSFAKQLRARYFVIRRTNGIRMVYCKTDPSDFF